MSESKTMPTTLEDFMTQLSERPDCRVLKGVLTTIAGRTAVVNLDALGANAGLSPAATSAAVTYVDPSNVVLAFEAERLVLLRIPSTAMKMRSDVVGTGAQIVFSAKATDPRIRHLIGSVSPQSPDWWSDLTSDSGFLCYGPYIPLDAGAYTAYWGFQSFVGCPPPWLPGGNGGSLLVAICDVVTGHGQTSLNQGGMSWGVACSSQNGPNITHSINFSLFQSASDVEVRIQKIEGGCIATELFILKDG